MLNRRITTPAILSSELLRQNRGSIIDCGCVWDNRRSIPSDPDKLLLLPHRSLPLHAPRDMIEQFDAPIRMRHDGAAGVVVHPAQIGTSIPDGLDLYLIGAARMLGMRAGLLVDCVLKLKNNIRADTAVYAPALATPENLAILIYLGIDLVDDTAAIIKGYQDVYLTRDGGKYLNRLREFPCTCKICTGLGTPEELQSLPRSERARLLAEHNTIKLGEELRTVRECIRDGNLREYVEKQCRSDPYLTAVLRLLDSEHAYLEERTPTARKGAMIANTRESQNRVEITRFAGRTLSRFSPPDVDILVILPCSAKKPYSLSRSHARFVDALSGCRSHIHEIVLTSPIGVVPRELEAVYPAAHYDIAVTGEWSLDETAWVASCLRAYLEKHAYKKIIAHVSGGFAEVCRIVERDLGIEIVYSAIGNPTSDDSLARLRECVAASVPSQSRNKSRKPNLETVRAIADYQFGSGVGEILIPDHARVKRVKPIARMKSMRQIKQGHHGFRILVDREEIAASLRYGTLALTLAGAARMPDDIYCVTIDNFLPKGSVLAPGVTGSDPQIRPMDEVIVLGERAFGVGVAMMNGREMIESSRGVAVEMRAVQER